MSTPNFFNESKEQSIIKAQIVSKYFFAWAKVILSTLKRSGGDRLAYIDLFSGPGRYVDGTQSTPLMVLEKTLHDPDMRQMLITIFNDKDEDNVASLKEAILAIEGISSLKYKPQVYQSEVGEDMVNQLEQIAMVPTLFFVDPFGYKGLSLRLINAVVKNWGSDCIFFFNYNRVNMGIRNRVVESHMMALFGEERIRRMQEQVQLLESNERESFVVEELCNALREMGGKFVLPFCFKNDRGTRTSHYLIFVSKSFKGYEIMKEVMAKESSQQDQGVPSFIYSPATERQPLLFELTRPLDDLQKMLLYEYKGRTIHMDAIYQQHSVNRPFIKKNYKQILIQIEENGLILCDPPQDKRRKGTLADRVIITFS